MTKITITSDLHGTLPDTSTMEPCDLFIVCGDSSPIEYDRNQERCYDWFLNEFDPWMAKIPAQERIFIGGNHDFALEDSDVGYAIKNATYLEGDSIEFDGLKIYGLPWVTLWSGWAFSYSDDNILQNKILDIPDDVDILVSHGPAHSILDNVPGSSYWNGLKFVKESDHVGSRNLYKRIFELKNLKLMCHGHIHSGYGVRDYSQFKIVNAAYMDNSYKPTNSFITVEIET